MDGEGFSNSFLRLQAGESYLSALALNPGIMSILLLDPYHQIIFQCTESLEDYYTQACDLIVFHKSIESFAKKAHTFDLSYHTEWQRADLRLIEIAKSSRHAFLVVFSCPYFSKEGLNLSLEIACQSCSLVCIH